VTSDSRALWTGLAAVSIALTACGIAAMVLTNSVVYLGDNIPNTDIWLDYTWGVACAIALAVLIPWITREPSEQIVWVVAWALKVMVTLVVMLSYEHAYWFLDSYGYFDEPRSVEYAKIHFGSGTENVKAIIWLLYRVFPESFHALKIVFSFVGLLAVFIIYRASAIFLGFRDPRLFLFYALFPSVLFWSSTIGKDPIALFGIAVYVYGAAEWYVTAKLRGVALIAFGILIAATTRVWLGPLLILPLIVAFVASEGRVLTRLGLFVIAGLSMFVLLSDFLYDLGIASVQDVYSGIEQTAMGFSQGQSSQEITVNLADPGQFTWFLPIGMFTALFRPLPGEVRNVFGLLAGLENAFLLILLARCIFRVQLKEMAHPLVIAGFTLVLAWSATYSFISYGNFGNAVRYKLQILPVVLALLLFLGRRRTVAAQWHA
jgi:hypothetical protein